MHQPQYSQSWSDYCALLALAVMWSASFTTIKVAVEGIPPITLAAFRLLLAALILWLVVGMRAQRVPFDRLAIRHYIVVGSLGNAVPFALIGWGELHISSGSAAVLMGLMPLVTAALAHFLADDPLNPQRIIGISLGFVGLLILLGDTAIAGVFSGVLGQLSVLGGALCYALTTVYVRRSVRLSGSIVGTGALLLGSALITPVAIVVDQPWTLNPGWQHLSAAVFLGVFPTAVATLIYFRLVRRIGATNFSQVNYLIPGLGVLWGFMFLHERPGWQALLALSCIIVGMVFVTRRITSKK